MKWTVEAIRPDQLKMWWPVVGPLLAPAVRRSGGRVTMPTLFAGLREGRYLLWVAQQGGQTDAAFITRVSQYPARKMLTVDFAGGSEMGGWLEEAVRTFRSFACQTGLSGVEMYGRPGWTRALRKFGWRQTGVLCETDARPASRARVEADG